MPQPVQQLYIYCFCENADGIDNVSPPDGVGGAPVRLLCCDDIAVVVSDAPQGRIRPQRRTLAAHQSIVRSLAQQQDVLPVTFGIVAPSESAVRSLVSRYGDDLRAQLERIRGCLEMTIRLRWDVEDPFAHLLSLHDDLRHARDQAGDSASRDQVIALGQRVERALDAERADAYSHVSDVLEEVVREIGHNMPRDASQLVSAAALVRRECIDDFEQGVHRVASGLDETYVLEMSGPWPTFSFVDLRLDFEGDESEPLETDVFAEAISQGEGEHDADR